MIRCTWSSPSFVGTLFPWGAAGCGCCHGVLTLSGWRQLPSRWSPPLANIRLPFLYQTHTWSFKCVILFNVTATLEVTMMHVICVLWMKRVTHDVSALTQVARGRAGIGLLLSYKLRSSPHQTERGGWWRAGMGGVCSQSGHSSTGAQSSLCCIPLTSQTSNHEALKDHGHGPLTTAP